MPQRRATERVTRMRPSALSIKSDGAGADRRSHAAPREDVRDGAQQDLDVAPQRPLGDVEVVELDHLGERDAVRP